MKLAILVLCTAGLTSTLHSMDLAVTTLLTEPSSVNVSSNEDLKAHDSSALLSALRELSAAVNQSPITKGTGSFSQLSLTGFEPLLKKLSALKTAHKDFSGLFETLYTEKNFKDFFSILTTANSLKIEPILTGFFTFLKKEVPLDMTTILMQAASSGFHEIVQLCLEHGAQVNAQDTEGKTSLILASLKEDLALVQILLTNKANPNKQDSEGKTALIVAIDKKNEALAKLLLEESADANIEDHKGWTALIHASAQGNVPLVTLLLAHKAHLNKQDKEGKTALIVAIDKKNEALTKLLLEESADANIEDHKGWTALIHASAQGNVPLVTLLLAHKAHLNKQDKEGKTALYHAIAQKHQEVVGLLLKAGADVTLLDNEGDTPLMEAVFLAAIFPNSESHQKIVQSLLDHDAPVNTVGRWKRTPLSYAFEQGRRNLVEMLLAKGGQFDMVPTFMAAATAGHHEILELLLKRGADVDMKDKEGKTALMHAASRPDRNDSYEYSTGLPATVRFLLERKANVNIQDNSKKTALIHACSASYEAKETVKVLLAYDADVNLQDSECNTALLNATRGCHTAVVRMLLTSGKTEVDKTDKWDRTALMYAEAQETAQLLLEHKADVLKKDTEGKTALIHATSQGRTAVAQELLRCGAEVNAQDKDKKTALLHAIGSHSELADVVHILLEAQADSTLTSKEGIDGSALVLAVEKGHTQIAQMLLDRGADATIKDSGGKGLLCHAAAKGKKELVELIYKHSTQADVHEALKAAVYRGHREVAEFLKV